MPSSVPLAKRMERKLRRSLVKHLPKRPPPPAITLTTENALEQLRTILSNRATGQKLTRKLELWDIHDDGHVSRKEFRSAVATLGVLAPHDALNTIFDEIDADGNGEVDFEEFFEWYVTH